MNPLRSKSPRGHNPYLLLSAIQKFARRSMEEEMLYCCFELANTKGCFPILKNRLAIVCYEDVGLANESLVNSIENHLNRMESLYKANNGGWRLVLGYIVMSICRGKKSRIVDEFISAVAFDMVNGNKIDFEDEKYFYIYDGHTRKGKSLGRGREFFFEHSVKIEEYNFDKEPNYQQLEIDRIDKAYEKGNAWDLLGQPSTQGDLFKE